jgi:hypothetical protein
MYRHCLNSGLVQRNGGAFVGGGEEKVEEELGLTSCNCQGEKMRAEGPTDPVK